MRKAPANDNDEKSVIDLESLSNDQLQGLCLYLFGLVEAINGSDIAMTGELAEARDLPASHMTILQRWIETQNRFSHAVPQHLQNILGPRGALN